MTSTAKTSTMSRNRLQRTYRRHSVLAGVSAVGLVGLAALLPLGSVFHRWGVASAYTALAFLAATLLVGPLNVWLDRRNPVSNDVRRDLGLWSGLHALIHTGVGLYLHGVPLSNFVKAVGGPFRLGLRLDPIGLANGAGLVALGLLAFLSYLSNDRALTRLKARLWKRSQRWAYLAFALTLAHGLTYLLVQGAAPGLLPSFAVLGGAVVLAQGLGVWRRIRGKSEKVKHPL